VVGRRRLRNASQKRRRCQGEPHRPCKSGLEAWLLRQSWHAVWLLKQMRPLRDLCVPGSRMHHKGRVVRKRSSFFHLLALCNSCKKKNKKRAFAWCPSRIDWLGLSGGQGMAGQRERDRCRSTKLATEVSVLTNALHPALRFWSLAKVQANLYRRSAPIRQAAEWAVGARGGGSVQGEVVGVVASDFDACCAR
jgi:hypothetical protein